MDRTFVSPRRFPKGWPVSGHKATFHISHPHDELTFYFGARLRLVVERECECPAACEMSFQAIKASDQTQSRIFWCFTVLSGRFVYEGFRTLLSYMTKNNTLFVTVTHTHRFHFFEIIELHQTNRSKSQS